MYGLTPKLEWVLEVMGPRVKYLLSNNGRFIQQKVFLYDLRLCKVGRLQFYSVKFKCSKMHILLPASFFSILHHKSLTGYPKTTSGTTCLEVLGYTILIDHFCPFYFLKQKSLPVSQISKIDTFLPILFLCTTIDISSNLFWNCRLMNMYYSVTRKYLIYGYILGLLTHTIAWNRHWGGNETLKRSFIYLAWLPLA